MVRLKHEMKKKQEGEFIGAMAALVTVSMASLLIQPMTSSLINAISRKRVSRAVKNCGFLPLFALPLIMKVLGKKSQEQEENKIKQIIRRKTFIPSPSFKQYGYYYMFQLGA